jgi:TfoX/Sxy family transcriptional regulator of competence genes
MIMRDSLYLVVDEDTRQRYEDLGMRPFSYQTTRGTRALRHYRQVPPDVVEDRETLCRWAADALDAAAASAGTAVRHPRQRDDG